MKVNILPLFDENNNNSVNLGYSRWYAGKLD